MNILFIDNDKIEVTKLKDRYHYKIFGYIFNKYDEKIKSLHINFDRYFKKALLLNLKFKYKDKKVYIVLSRILEDNIEFKNDLSKALPHIIFVTEQNNLMTNDYKYIEKYINLKKLDKYKLKCLFVIDNFNSQIKEKIMQYLFEFKSINVLCKTKNTLDVAKYVKKINKEYGTCIEILDKTQKSYYNILLVFSREYEEQNKDSFVLHYRNSDFDVESITYLNYIKNKEKLEGIFNHLNLMINRFEKTKLGKLYVHGMKEY